MSYKQRIYEDFDDYYTLERMYANVENFVSAISQTIDYGHEFDFLGDVDEEKLILFCEALGYTIYYEYFNDKLAYKEADDFMNRICNSLVYKINKWYLQGKIDNDLLQRVNLDHFTISNTATTSTGELGVSGSVVEQESASTPTGIVHDNSDTTSLEMEHDSSSVSIETSSGYQDKYTNFMGKTQGVKQNRVDRDVDSERKGNYILAMDLLKAIPYSYINEVLMEVSKHFIQVY